MGIFTLIALRYDRNNDSETTAGVKLKRLKTAITTLQLRKAIYTGYMLKLAVIPMSTDCVLNESYYFKYN